MNKNEREIIVRTIANNRSIKRSVLYQTLPRQHLAFILPKGTASITLFSALIKTKTINEALLYIVFFHETVNQSHNLETVNHINHDVSHLSIISCILSRKTASLFVFSVVELQYGREGNVLSSVIKMQCARKPYKSYVISDVISPNINLGSGQNLG